MGVALVWCTVATAAAQQAPPDARYLGLVSRYADGAYVASVVEAVNWRPDEATEQALDALQRQSQLYEQGIGTRGRPALGGRDYLAWLRAASALHLEAAISAPPGRHSARLAHLQIGETVLRELDASRDVAWKRDATVGPATRAALLLFRRDWHLVAATHFQRAGAFADALRLASAASREFPDQAVFHVIAGSIFEALGSAAAFDGVRAFVGLAGDPDDNAQEALRQATRGFERALVLAPGDAEARVRLARVHVLLGRPDLARPYLADDAPPGRLAYLLALARGHAAEAEQRYDAAVDHYRQATGVSDRWQSACVALSHALSRRGRLDDARRTVRECLSRESASSDPWPGYAMGLAWLVEPTVRQLRARIRDGEAAPHD